MALDENNQSPIDEKYKEGKGSYYNSNSLNNAEDEAAADNNQDSSRLSTANNIENNENNSAITPSWNTNLSSMTTNLAKSKLKTRTSVKKGPLTFIIIAFLAFGGGATVLFLPSTLFLQIANVMETKFNRQLPSYKKRMYKTLNSQLTSTNLTSGVCSSTVSFMCKYSTLSKNEVKNLKDNGVEVTYDEDSISSKLGRVKPKNLKFNGETISSKDFSTRLSSDTEFSSAIDKAFTPEYTSFSDKVWKSFSNKVKIFKGKNAVNEADDDTKKMKAVQDETESGEKATESTSEYVKDNEKDMDKKTKDNLTKDSKNIDDTQSELSTAAKDADGVATSTSSDVLAGVGKAANFIKVDGWVSNVCAIYRAAQGLAYAAKAVRAYQLIRFAMLILNESDQIKSGDAKPNDVSFYGNMLTTETKSEDGSYKAATDSYGYKYAAYNEVGRLSSSASMFLVGGGLTGELSGVLSYINSQLGGKQETVCKIDENKIVQAGSLVLGIALLFVPEVRASITIMDVIKMARTSRLY